MIKPKTELIKIAEAAKSRCQMTTDEMFDAFIEAYVRSVKDHVHNAACEHAAKGVRFIPRGADLPLPELDVTVDEDDVERAMRAWDRAMPEFAGLLDADVVNRKEYEGI